MIVEQRTYTIKPLRTGDFLALYERLALPLQKRHFGQLIGFFVSEVGPLNQVVQLWAFATMADREKRRVALDNDPAWPAFRTALRELDVIVEQEARLLKSVHFSPV